MGVEGYVESSSSEVGSVVWDGREVRRAEAMYCSFVVSME